MPEGTENELFHALEKGMKGETVHAVQKLLETKDEMAVVNDYLIPALDKVGQGFEKGTIFLPQMMQEMCIRDRRISAPGNLVSGSRGCVFNLDPGELVCRISPGKAAEGACFYQNKGECCGKGMGTEGFCRYRKFPA